MASSSPISTSAQLTAIERLGWDLYSFFRVEYPEKNKTQIRRFGSLMVEGSTSVFTAQLAGAMDKRVMP
jgi:hypothetical protein